METVATEMAETVETDTVEKDWKYKVIADWGE